MGSQNRSTEQEKKANLNATVYKQQHKCLYKIINWFKPKQITTIEDIRVRKNFFQFCPNSPRHLYSPHFTVPVSQVHYLVGSRNANKCGAAVASLEMVPSWLGLDGRCHSLKYSIVRINSITLLFCCFFYFTCVMHA